MQRLHGMGYALYWQMQAQTGDHAIPLRVYAPIGSHKDLLPYLVRRLLENGTNSSLVNRSLDAGLPVEQLIRDNYAEVTRSSPYRHKQIPLPLDIYLAAGHDRKNAKGIDLDCPVASNALLQQMAKVNPSHLRAAPIVNGLAQASLLTSIYSPADPVQVVGQVSEPRINYKSDSKRRKKLKT